MNSSNQTLLEEARSRVNLSGKPQSSHKSHALQFFGDEALLAQQVSRFVAEGLEGNNGVIVIATAPHNADILSALRSVHENVDAAIQSGQLKFVDAAATLDQIMVHDTPDRDRFHETVGGLMRETKKKFPVVRVYGEMVNLLWESGNSDATLGLEGLWNELLADQPLLLLCGYSLSRFASADQVENFRQICDAHDLVAPMRDRDSAEPFNGHAMVIAKLQQQTIALHNELKRRERAEQQVRISDERLRLAFQAGGFGHWTLDLTTGKVEFSPELEQLFGLEPGAFGGRFEDVLEFVHPEDREAMENTYRTALIKSDRYENNYRIIHPSGEVRWCTTRAQIHRDPQGAPTHAVGVIVDVSAQKQNELILLQAKEDAEAANRSKSSFLANMSHEIRTPLGAILGFGELLKDPGLTQADKVLFIDTINRNGRELAQLVDDILDLSKVEAGRIEIEKLSVSLQNLLSDIAISLSIKAQEKGISLTFETDDQVPKMIVTDPTRLRQILLYIVGNALKFTNQGEVCVLVKHKPGIKDVAHSLIEFTVKDTGCGISEKDQKRLFQPFSQGDSSMSRKFGGSGLGLILSRKLANALGGDITIAESTLGVGSSFRITIDAGPVEKLRIMSQEPVDTKSSDPKASAMSLKDVRILLAEDARDNQILLQRILSGSGATIDVVGNGSDAVKRAMERTYDVVLMDMQMPILDGYDAVVELRRRGYSKPIVALTAHAMREDREKSLRAGCNDHISKPINPKHLVYTVAQYAALQ